MRPNLSNGASTWEKFLFSIYMKNNAEEGKRLSFPSAKTKKDGLIWLFYFNKTNAACKK